MVVISLDAQARMLATLPYGLEERVLRIRNALANTRDPAGQKREKRLREKVVRLEKLVARLQDN